ncbi:MAG: Fic family protein [Chloroflexi bacterium]|nr:Fic family protein [Chloroflexota bacterium]
MNQFDPLYSISPPLLSMIKRITLLVHELNQHAVPTLVFMRMHSEARARSTYASTSIEGNPLPLTEVKRLIKEHPVHIRQSEQEVLNYNQVLNDLNQQLDQPLTAALLQQIHAGVMSALLPDHQLGTWRQELLSSMILETRRLFTCPQDYEDVPILMDALLAFVQKNRDRLHPLLLAGLFHKQMAIIHPFIDGNGRTTRLATKILLAGLGINTFNLFSF